MADKRIQDSRWYVSTEDIARHENKKFICPQTKLLNLLQEYMLFYGSSLEVSMKYMRYDLKHILESNRDHARG